MKVVKNIIAIIMLLLSIYCYKIVNDINIIPNKYLYVFLGILILLNILGFIFIHLKKKVFKVLSIIIYIFILIISIIGIWYGNKTINYLNHSFNNNKIETLKYNVIVLKKSQYKNRISIY